MAVSVLDASREVPSGKGNATSLPHGPATPPIRLTTSACSPAPVEGAPRCASGIVAILQNALYHALCRARRRLQGLISRTITRAEETGGRGRSDLAGVRSDEPWYQAALSHFRGLSAVQNGTLQRSATPSPDRTARRSRHCGQISRSGLPKAGWSPVQKCLVLVRPTHVTIR